MSNPPVQNTADTTGNQAADALGDLPAFQPFPVATPRRPNSQRTSSTTHQVDFVANASPQARHEDTSDPSAGGSQRDTNPPEFFPFPRAAAGSRWAPPDGVRPEPARPIPPPPFDPESERYPPARLGDPVRYPRQVSKV
ncbi:hypothetical protein RhiJN_07625 [Ceratobasidium sp. AG-Ba]|nr:hypothetical protein RhiJN_07625 [Ceratobasidium sp. AG-Ba]QRW08471.1 hypothetical protein RhiLY_07470 [Ceratobasidium sp. AG-Ba]